MKNKEEQEQEQEGEGEEEEEEEEQQEEQGSVANTAEEGLRAQEVRALQKKKREYC